MHRFGAGSNASIPPAQKIDIVPEVAGNPAKHRLTIGRTEIVALDLQLLHQKGIALIKLIVTESPIGHVLFGHAKVLRGTKEIDIVDEAIIRFELMRYVPL